MKPVITERLLAATPDEAFELVAHIDRYREAVPEIKKVEYLSDIERGVGCRFEETRMMGKREISVPLEVMEYEAPARVRIVSEAGGTVWDSVFEFSPEGNGCRMRLQMDAAAKSFVVRTLNRLIRPMVTRGVERDMDHVAAWFERAEKA